MSKWQLYVISHTHWDREWYQNFQEYRYRLVRMMDDLLYHLEQNPEFKVFHLDGQTVLLDDYLEIRPENKDRLTKLIHDRRILIGPWYTLPDEFLASGEAIIKNVQYGHKKCRDYGAAPMQNAYMVDEFGHASQIPQIFAGFHIHTATLYRGIGDFEKDAFLWQSPDGTRMTTAKLDRNRSYSNFYFALRWPFEEKDFNPEEAVDRMEKLLSYSEPTASCGAMLMMDGVDHIDIEPRIPEMLRLLEKRIPGIEFHHTSIEEYFPRLDTASLEVVIGTLYHTAREGVNNQVLKNVLSSMVHLKQSNDQCERLLVEFAEPLNAFSNALRKTFLPAAANDYTLAPRRKYLDTAWEYLLQNQAHDSICGCGCSETHRDNEYRFAQCLRMSRIAIRDTLEEISRNIRVENGLPDICLVYNPGQTALVGTHIIEMDIHADGLDGAILENPSSGYLFFYNSEGKQIPAQILSFSKEQRPEHRLRRLVSFSKMYRAKIALELNTPPFGYEVVSCQPFSKGKIDLTSRSYTFVGGHMPCRLEGSMMTGPKSVDNGVLEVVVQQDGTLDVKDKTSGHVYRGVLLFEDGGDNGDGWNYRGPAFDTLAYGGNNCQIAVIHDGPYVCAFRISHTLLLPCKTAGNSRSDEKIEQTIDTTVYIYKDSDTLRFSTVMNNQVQDHRLRVIFPTGLEMKEYYTKTPFDMTRWNPDSKAAATDIEPDTKVVPSQGVFYAEDEKASFSLYTRGLYEIQADCLQSCVKLTLLRSFPHETGVVQTEDVRMFRDLHFEYAAVFGPPSSPSRALIAGETYRAGVYCHSFKPNPQASAFPSRYGFAECLSENKIVSGITAEKSGGQNRITVRIFDVSGVQERVVLRLPGCAKKAVLVNHLGEQLQELSLQSTDDGSQVDFECGPNKIVAVAFDY